MGVRADLAMLALASAMTVGCSTRPELTPEVSVGMTSGEAAETLSSGYPPVTVAYESTLPGGRIMHVYRQTRRGPFTGTPMQRVHITVVYGQDGRVEDVQTSVAPY